MTQKEKQTWVFVGLGAIAAILIGSKLLQKLKIIDDPKVKATEKRKQDQLNKAIQDSSQKEKLTKSIQQWQIIADQIYKDLRYSAISDDKKDATYQVSRVQNLTDFLILYKLFGKRQEYLFGIPSGGLQDLQQFVRSNLSNDQIAKINWNYKNKGIQYQF